VLMAWFRQQPRSGAAIIAMYVCMLAASIALGAVISRYVSEPLNRRLRARAKTAIRLPQALGTVPGE
jgi:peptidoglycan/LPS O-acetylase OafA/YrhL